MAAPSRPLYQPIDWSQVPPLCPHGLYAGVCTSCGEQYCRHPGALPHTCAAPAAPTEEP